MFTRPRLHANERDLEYLPQCFAVVGRTPPAIIRTQVQGPRSNFEIGGGGGGGTLAFLLGVQLFHFQRHTHFSTTVSDGVIFTKCSQIDILNNFNPIL